MNIKNLREIDKKTEKPSGIEGPEEVLDEIVESGSFLEALTRGEELSQKSEKPMGK